MDMMEILAPTPPKDEGQRRMNEAAEAAMRLPEIYEQIHEHDADCQEERKRI